MSICPECHTLDKNFFAPKCHACNTEVGFLMQCAASLVYTATWAVGIIFLLWLFLG